MKLFVLLALIAFYSSELSVFGYESEHEYMVEKDICEVEKTITYHNYFNLIKLECIWNKFVHEFKTNTTNFFFYKKRNKAF